ncbi:MAG TPA: hypothetical protein VF739_10900 [Ktedonobacterales bacterium]
MSKSQLSRLLYLALIDLRAEGHSAENRLVFLLADLFHNIPLQLDQVYRGDLTPDDVLRWLHTRAHGTPMEAWLTLREQEVMAHRQGERNASQPGNTPDGEESP